MLKKALKFCFIAFTMLFLLVSFARAVLFPSDISWYEMRYAKKIPPVTASGYVDGSFQAGMDEALGDQISFATYFKKLYNEGVSLFDKCFTQVRNSIRERYVYYRNTLLFNGQLINRPVPLDEHREGLKAEAEMINEKAAALPETEFYLFYVENDSDIDFEKKEKTGSYEYFVSQLDIPEENCAAFTVNSFEEYQENFYYADHHWNHKGSYKAYLQLFELLGLEGEPLKPTAEVDVPGIFNGSKALLTGTTHYAEHMKAYLFDYPPMKISQAGRELPDYGSLTELLASGGDSCSYGAVYGDDLGCGIFEGQGDEKILIVGDSYDNAVLKLLAGYFKELHSVDIRYYPPMMGHLFDEIYHVEKYGIDKVLYIGCSGYFGKAAEMGG